MRSFLSNHVILVLILFLFLLLSCFIRRLSEEMVACIAVEAISILEQLHHRGYLRTFPSLLRSFYFLGIMFIISWFSPQICAWRCKTRKLFAWSTWNAWWKEVVPGWSWFGYVFKFRKVVTTLDWHLEMCLYFSSIEKSGWNCNCSVMFSSSASRWKNASSGRHVDYDQKPDVFRWPHTSLKLFVVQ